MGRQPRRATQDTYLAPQARRLLVNLFLRQLLLYLLQAGKLVPLRLELALQGGRGVAGEARHMSRALLLRGLGRTLSAVARL